MEVLGFIRCYVLCYSVCIMNVFMYVCIIASTHSTPLFLVTGDGRAEGAAAAGERPAVHQRRGQHDGGHLYDLPKVSLPYCTDTSCSSSSISSSIYIYIYAIITIIISAYVIIYYYSY